jgi:hypothetical protein
VNKQYPKSGVGKGLVSRYQHMHKIMPELAEHGLNNKKMHQALSSRMGKLHDAASAVKRAIK